MWDEADVLLGVDHPLQSEIPSLCEHDPLIQTNLHKYQELSNNQLLFVSEVTLLETHGQPLQTANPYLRLLFYVTL